MLSTTKPPAAEDSDSATGHRTDPFAEAYRHRLVHDQVVPAEKADVRDQFEALALVLRDRLAEQWLLTDEVYDRENPKRVYYLSMEFLLGRMLLNNVINLTGGRPFETRLRWQDILEGEPDAGLGNGGLGRLAACFVDSLATLQIPAMGYGLRYEYGIFQQSIENDYQVELPDHWLANADPWEVHRPNEAVRVPLGCSFRLEGGTLRVVPGNPSHLLAQPYDRPIVGFGGQTINTLRLWAATSPDHFDFGEFSTGDVVGAIIERIVAETVTRVLYPDDSTSTGQALRFVQEYFLVCCSLGDIIARFRRGNEDWQALPDKAAIQLNDTHPAMAVAELMRLLVDEAGLSWEESWNLTVRTLAYTNHTLLPEALEKWPVEYFELLCPRLLEIIYEINRRLLEDVRQTFPGDDARARRMSLVDESGGRQVQMAHLAIVGTHSTNGVAKIHSDLLRTRVVADFSMMFPERFNNKTNGVTPRRWIALANPELSAIITDAVGGGWLTDMSRLRALRDFETDEEFLARFRAAKRTAKEQFASWLQSTSGVIVDPESIFDSQIKRIHEYKRQLLSALHIVTLYDQLRESLSTDFPSRTFFFAGKAAPAYRLAKLIIKLIGNIGRVIDAEPTTCGRLKVVFLPNYNVSLAERLIPASEISEQISTAGYEASGTGNMKFMMNGALTIGTRDGATIEMAEEAGEENVFFFGLSADEVQNSRSWYDPRWHYEHDEPTRRAIDLIASDHFSRDEPGIFRPILEALLDQGDYYMHLADLGAYADAHRKLGELYRRPDAWTRTSLRNVASSARFSSDRTIAEYATEIWHAVPCPIG